MTLLTITSLFVGSGSAFSGTVEKMKTRYRDVKTLTAEFSQKQTNAALGSTKESSGRIYVKRPGMFRWETISPDASVLVGNGKKVWYYTPPFRDGERGQVMVRRAAEAQSKLAIDLLAGHADVKKEFKSRELGQAHVELTPRKPAGDITHLELFLEKPTNLVYKILLFTATGNHTELTFSNVKLEPKLSNSMFNFVPPPNTEEIR